MPFLNFLSIYTFREHHPDWKIIFIKPKDEAKAEGKWDTGEHSIELVDDPEIDYSKFVGRYVDETWQFDFTELLAENLEVNDVHKADVLRPHLMHTYGGVWSDMDILFLQPMETLDLSARTWFVNTKDRTRDMCLEDGALCEPAANKDIDMVVSHYHLSLGDGDTTPVWRTGMFWSTKDNPVFKKIAKKSIENLNTAAYQSAGPDAIGKLWPKLEDLKEEFPDLKLANMQECNFYPYHFNGVSLFFKGSRFNLRGSRSIRPNTVGIHWYNGNRYSKALGGLSERAWKKNTQYIYTIKPYRKIYNELTHEK